MVQKRKANPFKQFRQDILRYKSIVLATHTVPDADSLFCLSALEAICKELNPEITVYPVAESSRAGLDCKTILQKYGLKYLEPNADIPENPDAVFLVDTQLTRRAVLPISLHSTNANESQKDDLDGRLELEGIEVHVRDHHRSQESDSLVDRADFKTYFIDDEKFHSCAALLLHEFADTKFVRENLAQNEGLCTLGHQAIRIDSPGFRNLTDADTNALKIFGGGKLNHEVIHGVNNLPLSDVEGNLLAVMLKSSSRMQLEGFATYCHLGIVDPDREKEYILPTVTDEMLRMASTNGIAVASAVYKGVNGSESELAFSFRLNGTASNLNAANIARLFNGGGDLRRAGARMNLGMLKYSCSTEDFLKLISHEVKMRLMSSPYSGIDDDKKPIPSRYDPSRELTELVNGTEMDDKDFKVLGTLRQVRKRANGKYLSLGVNIYPNPAEDDMFIGEDDVNTLLEINQAMVRRWGKKGYEEVQGNIIYSLVNQGVHPYFLGFHCIKSGDDEETARNAELVKDIFGPVILDEVNIVDSVGDIKYELRVIKAPIIELKYPPLHDSLIRCLDYEMNQRIARTLGSQE